MLEHQNEHVAPGFLRIFLWTSKFATSKSMFRARLPSIFSTSHKMPHLPPEFAPCHHLRQPWQCDSQKTQKTSHKTRLVLRPATQNEDGHIQSAAPATKPATHLLKTLQKYCACRTKPLSTRYETHLNVTKSHGCHAKRGYVTCETSKSHSCRTRHRHGHIATSREQLRTVAEGCGRKRNVERTLATHSGKKEPWSKSYAFHCFPIWCSWRTWKAGPISSIELKDLNISDDQAGLVKRHKQNRVMECYTLTFWGSPSFD